MSSVAFFNRAGLEGGRHWVVRIQSTVNTKQLFLGSVALLVGLMEYVLNRPSASTYVGKWTEAFPGEFPFKMDIFGFLGGVLPEFVHPFCFALVTIALFPEATKKLRAMTCLFWLTVELFFELGQLFGQQMSQCLSKAASHNVVIEPLRNYFLYGTYDHLDVIAICLGITTAYVISGQSLAKNKLSIDRRDRK